ncbi:beta-ketoacyl-ACP synthase II [Gammaproteobacteria bacterium]|nr:beta-ketoacyl-ACP synthase II [Gammaproteobacteria bacterium]
MNQRVVITGLGTINCLGSSLSDSWCEILAGKSGIVAYQSENRQSLRSRVHGPIQSFNAADYLDPAVVKKTDPFVQYALISAKEAITQSALMDADINKDDIGVIMTSGIGGLAGLESNINIAYQKSAKRISPFYIPSTIINVVSGHVSMAYGFRGPSYSPVSACASGTHAIGLAMRAIQCGDAQVVIAGGSEAAGTYTGMGGFSALRALSTRNDDPQGASRPFDRDRDGFVLSDGAGAVVLESLEHAQKRGANILAECVGFGMSSDAFHITQPDETGAGAQLAIERALNNAHAKPNQIDYINAHGTSTPYNDRIEATVIKRVYQDHIKDLAVSSTKSMVGHSLGAAGAIEAVFTIQAMQDSMCPPTINLANPDEAAQGLNLVPNQAQPKTIHRAMSHSFGFGGTNAVLMFQSFCD